MNFFKCNNTDWYFSMICKHKKWLSMYFTFLQFLWYFCVLPKNNEALSTNCILVSDRLDKADVHLCLPAATLDPNALLGLLRDYGISIIVHMSTGLEPKPSQIRKLEKIYKKYGCSICWDAKIPAEV